jgi:VWFA-related protein
MIKAHPHHAALALGLLAAGAPLAAQPVQTLAVNTAIQLGAEAPAVRVYFDALDAVGQELPDLRPEELSATLGEATLEVRSLTPFAETGEGVAYVFVVDTSMSLSPEQFNRIRSALAEWIGGLRPNDRAAIVAFGSEVRLVTDFTADRELLNAGLGTLGATDAKTLLFRGLLEALDLGQRRDPDLPNRRAAVVLSDGFDEGSGLTPDDALARLRAKPMPIYAIGYSQLPEPRRRTYLDVLLRLATNSGGAFYEADRSRFAEAYAAIRHAIARVWVADFTCAGCRTDGNEYHLQLTVRRQGRVLAHGTDVRMLPLAGLAPPGAAEPPISERAGAPAAARAARGEDAPATGRSTDRRETGGGGLLRLWPFVALAAMVAALVAWLVTRLARRPAGLPAPPDGPLDPLVEPARPLTSPPPYADRAVPKPLPSRAARAALAALESRDSVGSPATTAVARPTQAVEAARFEAPRRIRLIVLRGSRPGKEYSLTLGSSAVVGSRSTCELVLTDEREVAARQFELAQQDRRVMIRNLTATAPTLLNGLAIIDWELLKSNDLVGTGETILRIVYS